MSKLLKVTSSPHIRHEDSTRGIMLDVIIALLPAAVYGCILFGLRAAIILALTITTAVASEAVWNIALKKPQTIGDLSAVLTGLLLGMNLSSQTPFWIAAIGSVVAIIVVKQMFGGLGFNFANPAMTARIVLLVSFAGQMSNYAKPIEWWSSGAVDALSSATPLACETTYTFRQLFFGMHSGAIGETSSFLLIIGGLYLMLRRVIKPIIPVAFIGTVAIATLIAGADLKLAIFGGGLMLGAIFMATDYVTTPTTNLGKLVFGIGCGLITFVIRQFGSLPEGVSYAILLMNILTPHINRLTLSKPFGAKEVAKS
ncbi:MAG: RnfABCDGE type electron transport complex subunit D [Ruminococcaceae bacterium]|nr:RnfABCDGE type electron transport complex subunit D [Oscillospiraceae bacterium]